MTSFASKLAFLAAFAASPALAQSLPAPATLGLSADIPNVLQVLDSNRRWAIMGTVDPFTHVYTPIGGGGGGGGGFVGAGNVANVSGSLQTGTGSITGGSTALTLLSASDFVNGEGVAVPSAGATFAGAPTTCSASTVGQTGVTAITYWVASLDSFGGSGPANPCSVANANIAQFHGYTSDATGTTRSNVVTVTSVDYGTINNQALLVGGLPDGTQVNSFGTGSGGVGTYNLSNTPNPFVGTPSAPATMGVRFGPRNNVALTITPGALATITAHIDNGLTGANLGPGNVLTVTAASGSPLAIGQTVRAAGLSPSGPALTPRIIGYKTGAGGLGSYYIDSALSQVASESMTTYAGYAVWKQCTANCGGMYTSEAYLGAGDQTTFTDAGLLSYDAAGSNSDNLYRPIWLPQTHPTSAGNDWCVRKIASGGGTSNLVLSASCPNTASAQTVRHDDTDAFNACLATTVGPENVQCFFGPGVYSVNSALQVPGGALVGCGQNCSEFQWWGTQDFASVAGTNASLRNFYVSGRATDSTGKALNYLTAALGHGLVGNKPAAMGPIEDLYFYHVYDGMYLYQPVVQFIRNIKFAFLYSETASCFHLAGDSNVAFGSLIYTSCSVIGGTTNYNTTNRCYWFDGHIGGGSYWMFAIASCAGQGMRISNDRGGDGTPFGMKLYNVDSEFAISNGLWVGGGAKALRFVGSQFEANALRNFIDCETSAGVVLDSSTSNITFDGGAVYSNAGAGVYSNGLNNVLGLKQVYNNSSRGSGGQNQLCSGFHLGSNSAFNIVNGAAIGMSGDKQLAPVTVDLGGLNNVVSNNAFNAAGLVYAHPIDNGTGTLINCNVGSDSPYDCNGPPIAQPGASYVGPADIITSGLTDYWGLRCVAKAYAGNVAAVWDALTGLTTETLLTCLPGGFLNQTLNPLTTTCANGCVIGQLYDQIGTNHFVQATNSLRPGLALSGCGLRAYYPWCMTFNGSQYLKLTSATSTPTQPFDFGVVAERTGNLAATTYLMTFGTGATLRYPNVTNNVTVNFGNSVNATAADSSWHSLLVEPNGAAGAIQVDATLATAQNFGSNNGATTWTLGAANSGASPITGNVVSAFLASTVNGSLWPMLNQNQHAWFGF